MSWWRKSIFYNIGWRTRKEAETARGDAESNVIRTEWHAKNSDATDGDANVGDEQGIDSREVGNVTGYETANSVGDANNREEESGRFFVDTLAIETIESI